ncbi:MAG: hypothetical protein LBL60_03490 [Mycoplasmataceae bacterium]|nr:hypothetical protein [Mycoplasmataceae bacterium]
MEYINKVEISGEIAEIRTSEKGTNFVMLKQMVTYNNIERPRLFEVLIAAERKELTEKISVGKMVKFIGILTVFKMKKFNIHKMLIEANSVELI